MIWAIACTLWIVMSILTLKVSGSSGEFVWCVAALAIIVTILSILQETGVI